MTGVRWLQNLRAVLNFTDGESDHCWERLRGADCCHLRGAGKPQSVGAGRPAAWWAALYDDIGGKLSRISRRNRWAGADPEHAHTGRKVWLPVFIRGSYRFRSER